MESWWGADIQNFRHHWGRKISNEMKVYHTLERAATAPEARERVGDGWCSSVRKTVVNTSTVFTRIIHNICRKRKEFLPSNAIFA